MSASIASYKACDLVSRLVKDGCEVQVVTTQNALQFIGPATLEGLTGKKVLSDMFGESKIMEHIHLDRWADAVILCPATANTINELAAGLGDDLVKTLFLAHDFKKPYFLVPAMNEKMWMHPATRVSLEKLSSWGVKVLEPASGSLACGEVGVGRMMEPEEIFNLFSNGKMHGRVLITSGGTREPIDGVRYIGNVSTGITGATIADQFIQAGYQVTLLKSETAVPPQHSCEISTFLTFDDLKDKLYSLLGERSFDVVIHSAAVSDFSMDSLVLEGGVSQPKGEGKIGSSNEVLLKLKRNPKLINSVKEISQNKKIILVGFKLTVGVDDPSSAVEKVFNESGADYVVHNDITKISSSDHRHEGVLYKPSGKVSGYKNKLDLAKLLTGVIGEVNP